MTSLPAPPVFKAERASGLSGGALGFKIFHICEMPAAESDRIPFL